LGVLTEASLRLALKGADLGSLQEYRVESGTVVTPSARAWLKGHKIGLVIGERPQEKPPQKFPASSPKKPDEPSALPAFEKPARYKLLGGGYFDEKPEHLTALRGTVLVEKSHKAIRLRGRIDSLEAKITLTQLRFLSLGLAKGADELGETLEYVRQLMRAEVLGEELPEQALFGMDEAEMRSRSHTPKKYYGIQHFFASAKEGEAVALLNALRAETREVELVAYEAFRTESGEPERPDIVRALNRLSSAYYIMMFKAKTKEYEP
jgi:ethanolamine utilization cobalamin adenosyltransferase